MAPLAEAFIRVRAQTSDVRRDVNREFSGAGRDASREFERGFGNGGGARRAAQQYSRQMGGGGEFGRAGQSAGREFSDGVGRGTNGRTRVKIDADMSDALNGVRILSGAIAALPVALPLAAGVAALAPAFAAAALGAGGLAAVAIPAISRIGEALKAQEAAQKAAATAGSQAQSRAIAQAGAQQALASAVRNAAFAHSQAVQQVRQAEQQLVQSQAASVVAQRALTQARFDARRGLQDMKNQLIDAGLAVQQQQLSVEQDRLSWQKLASAAQAAATRTAAAQTTLTTALAAQQAVAADPNATVQAQAQAKAQVDAARAGVKAAQDAQKQANLEARQAELNYKQSVQRLKEQQLELKRLQVDERNASRAGVEGSDQVRSARDRLAAANQQITDSERSLASARSGVARADAQSADAVASARRALATASLQGASSTAALDSAMSKLSPSAKTLMGDWKGLTGAFDKWQRSMEPKVLPLFSRGIALLKGELPSLTPVVEGASKAVGGLLTDVEAGAKSPRWAAFKKNLTELVPTAITSLGKSTGNIVSGVAGIFEAFMPYAPSALAFVEKITKKFGEWGAGLGSSPGFQKIMDWIDANGPQVATVAQQIGDALIHVGTSLAPVAGGAGMGAVGALGTLAKVINSLSPGQIQALATAFIGYKAAAVGTAAANSVFDKLKSGVETAKSAAENVGSVASGFRKTGSAAAGLVGGFRNVNSAFSENASTATRLGAGIRSQLGLWRQQAAAAWSSARATAASTAATAKAKAAAAGGWLQAQAAALRGAAAAQWANVRAAAASALATLRQRAAAIASAVASGIVRAATATWTAIQWLLNAAMSANPITLVIIAIVALGAALVLAYNKVGWFRAAVQAAWAGIQAASSWAWNNILKPIFGAIVWYITNVLVPGYKMLWSAVKMVWGWISAAISVAWNGIIKPIFNLIKWYVLNVVVAYFKFLWTIVKMVWAGIKATILGVWNNGIKPAFDKIKAGVSAVRNAFSVGIGAIGTAWDKMRGLTKSPVNFVIGTIYNKGIRSLWNKVMGWLHLPKSMQLGEVPMLKKGGSLANPASASPMMTNGPMAIVGEGRSQYPEYVIPTDPRYRGRAQALWASAGGDLQMLAGGGVLGSVLKGVKGVAGKVVSLGKGALDLITNPRAVWDRLVGEMVPSAANLGSTTWGQAMARIPKSMLDQAWNAASQIIKAFDGGRNGDVGGVVKAAARYIGQGDDRGMDNNNRFTRHFGWPAGTPWCALFASQAIEDARAKAHYPGAPTAAVAQFNASMKHVPTSAGRPGDLATYGSNSHVNIIAKALGRGLYETIGGNEGPRVKRGRRGGQATVLRPLATGGLLGEVFGQRNLDPRDRRAPLTQALASMAPLFDTGGMLPPGPFNRTRKPEPVMTDGQWDDIHTLAQRGAQGRQGPLFGDVHVHDGADVDALMQRARFLEDAGTF